MSNHLIITLKQSLPNCSDGTEFYLSLDEKYYYNEPDDTTKQYIFSIDEVESNKDFFYRGSKTEYDRYLIWTQLHNELQTPGNLFGVNMDSFGINLESLIKQLGDDDVAG